MQLLVINPKHNLELLGDILAFSQQGTLGVDVEIFVVGRADGRWRSGSHRADFHVTPKGLVGDGCVLGDIPNCGGKEIHYFRSLVEGFGTVKEDARALIDYDES